MTGVSVAACNGGCSHSGWSWGPPQIQQCTRECNTGRELQVLPIVGQEVAGHPKGSIVLGSELATDEHRPSVVPVISTAMNSGTLENEGVGGI